MIAEFFDFEGHRTSLKKEILAGITTFAAMASVLAVNPTILATTGMDKGALVTATALSVAVMTTVMGLVTNYPLVLGPGGGINAYFAFTICGLMGVPWRAALGLVFYGGVLFMLMSLGGIRQKIVEAIPLEMKLAITCGIGLFIAFIGLKNAGLVVGNPATLVALGRLSNPECLLALFGIIFTAVLVWWKIRGAIILGILAITLIGTVVPSVASNGMVTHLPRIPVGLPSSLSPLFMQLDVVYLWTHFTQAATLIITLLFVDIFDNMGTLIGVCNRAGLLDKDGQVPKIGRVFMADASAAMIGACIGTSTVTCYIESAAGVEEGGRTGATAIVAAACMLVALFFTPFILCIPAAATASALVIVGIFMMQGVADLNLRDFGKAVPAVITMIMMPLTFSISEGIGLGLITYVGFMIGTNRRREVTALAYFLALIFLLHDIF